MMFARRRQDEAHHKAQKAKAVKDRQAEAKAAQVNKPLAQADAAPAAPAGKPNGAKS